MYYFQSSIYHPDYHQPGDHTDKINWDKVVNITKASFLNMWKMANEKLPFK